MSSGLMPAEASRLAELELVVERGLATFVEVGAALLEIRDERYYRTTHRTFEDYCRERWDMSRARGYQLMDAARVVEAVSTTVDTAPANEAQARELVPLLDEPELMREAWAEASANGEPTAAAVRGAVERRRPAEDVPLEDVTVFHADTERVCPTCHGKGWIPLDERTS